VSILQGGRKLVRIRADRTDRSVLNATKKRLSRDPEPLPNDEFVGLQMVPGSKVVDGDAVPLGNTAQRITAPDTISGFFARGELDG